ncbi:anthranilate synthase component I family protein [Nonlabens ponticola]|uniref:Anthranilate synthase component I family protein n=2 Tax=Nonlabens ponticola TaxID=2496866 RepID=A0A3S9N1I5_9FLAO|nr:anthranilate synthase component I family protein [Nonlabens ponticola]
MLLDSNHAFKSSYNCLVAIGAIDVLRCDVGSAFAKAESFQASHEDWMFGYLGYDLKNELEPLHSNNIDVLKFPDLQFFIPELVIELNGQSIIFHSFNDERSDHANLLSDISSSNLNEEKSTRTQGRLVPIDTKEEYLAKAYQFLEHIQRGDIYEANLCTQFVAQDVVLDSIQAYQELNKSSKPPFAAYARFEEHYIISASPERYLKKEGNLLVSQPIKGTAARSADTAEDEKLKNQLLQNQKERSENVMIVDLVRNDLSRVATRGSVEVSELYGIHTFEQVHHMISTVQARLKPQHNAIDAIKATFPMGSMTGAPKISAMKIVEEQESFKRGVYSGAVGYFTPDADFDFNVVIRTILYNAQEKIATISVGSAITIEAIPEKEYNECFLKANALIQVLKSQGVEID